MRQTRIAEKSIGIAGHQDFVSKIEPSMLTATMKKRESKRKREG